MVYVKQRIDDDFQGDQHDDDLLRRSAAPLVAHLEDEPALLLVDVQLGEGEEGRGDMRGWVYIYIGVTPSD